MLIIMDVRGDSGDQACYIALVIPSRLIAMRRPPSQFLLLLKRGSRLFPPARLPGDTRPLDVRVPSPPRSLGGCPCSWPVALALLVLLAVLGSLTLLGLLVLLLVLALLGLLVLLELLVWLASAGARC